MTLTVRLALTAMAGALVYFGRASRTSRLIPGLY